MKYNIKVGDIYNSLTVLKVYGKRYTFPNGKHCILIKCRCICGNIYYAQRDSLGSRKLKTCGCGMGRKVLDNNMGPINQILLSYKNNAKARNLVWELSDEIVFIMIKSPCFYCGIINGNTRWDNRYKNKRKLLYNGIDRIDNNKGYTVENSVPCCGSCNLFKREKTVEQFITKVKNIYSYLQLDKPYTLLEMVHHG